MYDQHPILQNQRIHSLDGRLEGQSAPAKRPLARPNPAIVISLVAAALFAAATATGLIA